MNLFCTRLCAKRQTDILNKIVLAGIPGVKKAFLRAQEYQAWNAQGKLEKVRHIWDVNCALRICMRVFHSIFLLMNFPEPIR